MRWPPTPEKYGALANGSGTLDSSCTTDKDDVVLLWTERCGAAVSEPGEHRGFGTKLVARLAAQFGVGLATSTGPVTD